MSDQGLYAVDVRVHVRAADHSGWENAPPEVKTVTVFVRSETGGIAVQRLSAALDLLVGGFCKHRGRPWVEVEP